MARRRKRNELEAALSKCIIDTVKETSPGLRDSIRDLLDKGVTPAEMRKRYGKESQRGKPYDHKANGVALTVDWIIDEWERDRGLVKPDESIDTVESLMQ